MSSSLEEIEMRLELLTIELDVLAEVIKGIEIQANELSEKLRDV
jgi:hypothetical protein